MFPPRRLAPPGADAGLVQRPPDPAPAAPVPGDNMAISSPQPVPQASDAHSDSIEAEATSAETPPAEVRMHTSVLFTYALSHRYLHHHLVSPTRLRPPLRPLARHYPLLQRRLLAERMEEGSPMRTSKHQPRRSNLLREHDRTLLQRRPTIPRRHKPSWSATPVSDHNARMRSTLWQPQHWRQRTVQIRPTMRMCACS